MSDDQGSAPGPAGLRDRKRPGPTIDLQATEISRAPVAAASESASTSPPEGAARAESAARPAPGAPETNTPPDPSKPAALLSRVRAIILAWLPTDRMARWWSHSHSRLRSRLPAHLPLHLPAQLPWRLIGAGGAALALALVLILLASVFGRDGRDALDARLARVEQQARELAARPAASNLDPRAIDELASRVVRLETAAASPRPPVTDPAADPAAVLALTNRLATLEGQLKALDEKIGVVARRTDDFGTIAREARERGEALAARLTELAQTVARPAPQAVEHGEVDALATRIAALEKSATAIAAELAKRVTGEASDRGGRLATLASALDAAAVRGEPFAAPHAALKSLGADPKALAALEPFAVNGVPAAGVLARELLALLPALAKASGTASRDGGVLERLAANAEKLVRVRPIDDVPGDDPAAVLARIEARATQADITGALGALASLPAPARPLAAAWIAKAEARISALAASRQLATAALAALGAAP